MRPHGARSMGHASMLRLRYSRAERAPRIRRVENAVTEPLTSEAWESTLRRGRRALDEALAATGGAWTAEHAKDRLGVSRRTLLKWRREGRILALPRADGAFVYPVAQFGAPATDADPPRPFGAIRQILARAGEAASPDALFSLLATPQSMLADADGAPLTPFAALAAGRNDEVVAFIEWFFSPTDLERLYTGE